MPQLSQVSSAAAASGRLPYRSLQLDQRASRPSEIKKQAVLPGEDEVEAGAAEERTDYH